MCTVVIEVPESSDAPTRVLALRDEHPDRAWDPLGRWWPETPSVIGVHDRKAGGAWLSIDEERRHLAVILNRGEPVDDGGVPLGSRGAISLAAARGTWHASRPHTASFNLLEASPTGSRVTTWNGEDLSQHPIRPGVHMIAHSGLDDLESPRIAAWLERFRAASDAPALWRDAWTQILEESSELEPTDDRAIIRDNQPYGINTLTLYAVMAELSPAGVRLWHAMLDQPGSWRGAHFETVSV